MNTKLELEQKKEEINGIALKVYHESSSQLVNGHNTKLNKEALKLLTSSTKRANIESQRNPVSEMQVWELKSLVLKQEAKWRDKKLALLAIQKSKKKLVLRPILEGDDEELEVFQIEEEVG